MNYTITPSDSGDYIITKVHGEIDRTFGLHLAIESQAHGDKVNIRKFLIDVTESVNVDSVIDQYRFANSDLTESNELDHYSRIAVLVSPDDHSHDFIETVVRNVGINLRLFRNRQEALSFLGVESEEDQQTG